MKSKMLSWIRAKICPDEEILVLQSDGPEEDVIFS